MKLISTQNKLYVAIIATGLLGLFVGVLFPTWQHAVESGQVLAGTVNYLDNSNPFYIYHKYSVSLYNWLASVFLHYFSNYTVSIILSSFQGLSSYFALSLIVAPFLRARPFLIPLIVLALHGSGILEVSMPYPVQLTGSTGYGGIAQSLFTISCGLYALGYYRLLALNLCLLTPLVHPTVGILAIITVLGSELVVRLLSMKPNSCRSCPTASVITTAALLLLAASLIIVSNIHDSATYTGFSTQTKELTIEFIDSWSTHHRDFPFYQYGGFLFQIYFILIFYMLIRFRHSTDCPQLKIISFLSIAALGGLASAFLSHLPTLSLPLVLWQLMLPRIPNFVMFIFPAISLALVFNYIFKLFESHNFKRGFKLHKVIFLALATLFSVSILLHKAFDPARRNSMYQWPKESEFFHLVSGLSSSKKYILTGGMELIQLKSDRPTFTTHAFNQGLYLPGTWPSLLDSYNALYIKNKNDLSDFRAGTLHPGIYQAEWEQRSFTSWNMLANKYNLSSIITYRGWYLDLPLVASSDKYLLYLPNTLNKRPIVVQPKEWTPHNVFNALSLAQSNSYFWETKTPVTLTIEYPSATVINGISFKNIDSFDRMPEKMSIQLSDDGNNWHTVSNFSFDRIESLQKISFSSVRVRKYLRFRFESTHNPGEILRINEIKIFGSCAQNEFTDLIYGACYSVRPEQPRTP